MDRETNNLIGVHQKDLTYGESVSPEPIFADGATAPNGGEVNFAYKSASASVNVPFMGHWPKEKGTYLVRAVSSASGNVDSAAVESSFTIYGKEPKESLGLKYLNLKVGTNGEQKVDLTDYIPSDVKNLSIKTISCGPTEKVTDIPSMFKDSNELREETGTYARFELEGEQVGDVGQVISMITSDNYVDIVVVIEVSIVDKKPQNLSFENSQYKKTAANAGDTFTNPLTGVKTSVTYTVDGDTGILNINSNGNVTLTGVGGTAMVTATAKSNNTYAQSKASYIVEVEADEDSYPVTIQGGTGSGSYKPGEIVTISAQLPSGNSLDEWAVEDGEITLTNATATTTTFKMPDRAVMIKANLKGGSSQGLLGDVNGDGIVNTDDVTTLFLHVLEIKTISNPEYLAMGEVTGNDVVNTDDVAKLFKYVMEIISSLQ